MMPTKITNPTTWIFLFWYSCCCCCCSGFLAPPPPGTGVSINPRHSSSSSSSLIRRGSTTAPREQQSAVDTTTRSTPEQQQQQQQQGEIEEEQSDRLSKAKLLLELIINDDDANNNKDNKKSVVPSPELNLVSSPQQPTQSSSSQQPPSSVNGVTATDNKATTTATTGNKNKVVTIDNLPPSSSSSSSSPITTTTIVPDEYWNNGHLMGDIMKSTTNGQSNNNKQASYVTRWARGVKVAEPLVKYDPIAAEKLLFRQPAKWLLRNFQIALPVGWWAFNVVLDYVVGCSKQNRRVRAQQLRKAITDLGPAIIKGGQALSSRPDLLPSEYLEELQKLQDDVPRFSNELALRTVEMELGIDNFNDVFELVEQEPVAAASIGQVYKARLQQNGDIVALKIQRPKCEEIIALDLYVLRWWSGVYNNIFKLLKRDIDVQSITDDFGVLIYREIDYVAEAANAQRFNELYAANGVTKDVFVPKIYSDYTTSKVLTMEWVDGFRLTDTQTLSKYGLDNTKLVDTLVQCSLRQILQNGFFHADPHAGNLLAQPDGRLCYLDFGMMSYASSEQRNGFLLAVVHIVNRDWHELVRLYVRLGFIPDNTDLKPIEIALEDAMPDVLNADVSELNVKNIFSKLGDIMYTYPFSLPPFYIAIIRCLGVLEGLAIQVDPQARVVSKSYPYIASRVLTDKQEELQEAFRRLAFTNDGHVRWERLEGLLDEAKDSSGYDVSAALDLLTDYLIADDGDTLLQEVSQQLVDAADTLGAETLQYIIDASRAFAINDEVAAVRAFRSLTGILQEVVAGSDGDENGNNLGGGVDAARRKVADDLQDVLPEPTPSMKGFGRILSLLATQSDTEGTDPAKFVPIIRKLAQEPRIQETARYVMARLGERVLSRSLRAAFGLPAPVFDSGGSSATVTEEDMKYN